MENRERWADRNTAPYRTGGWASVLCCADDDCGDDVKANTNPADLAYIALANPATILELCALLEKAEADFEKLLQALVEMDHARRNPNWFTGGENDAKRHWWIWERRGIEFVREALAAIEQWKGE